MSETIVMPPIEVARVARLFDLSLPVILDTTIASGEYWRESSLCAQTDPETFFPGKGMSTTAAKRVCKACEVQAECLADALENEPEPRIGVVGGLSVNERKRLKKRMLQAKQD